MKLELINLKDEILDWCSNNKTGKEQLIILSAGDDSASEIYMKNKVATGENLEIKTLHIHCNSQEELHKNIKYYNDDEETSGIIVQLPLPKGYDEQVAINMINPNKDVDMLTKTNKASMFLGETKLLPATASGIMYTLDNIYGLGNLKGKDILLIGRSDLVNIPLQKTLRDLNCTVQLAHSHTKELVKKCRNSNIIITASGQHGLINTSCISDKVELILDVSINRVDGKIKGDVTDKVYSLTDVTANPRGLGCLTVPMLFKNLILMSKGE